VERRRTSAHERTAGVNTRPSTARAQRAMQDRRMGRVDSAFQRLQPVALLDNFRHVAMARRYLREFEAWRWRRLFGWSHVRPHDATHFTRRIVLDMDFFGETVFTWLVHLVDTVAVDVVFPAVVSAAETAFL